MTIIDILTTGGTIDKIYFDQKSEFEVGDPVIGPLLTAMGTSVLTQPLNNSCASIALI